MKAYFAGKIPKGDEISQQPDWRVELVVALNAQGAVVEMVTPENRALDESDSLAVFGHDCSLIKKADLVIVNADQKLGVGTAQEMLIAKYFSKPVLTLLPIDTHHRRRNLRMFDVVIPDWKHPFIVSTSDVVFDDVHQLRDFIARGGVSELQGNIKGIKIIDTAIEHYASLYELKD